MKPADVYVQRFLREHGVEHPAVLFEIRDKWSSLVTGRLATSARPVVITEGCLVLQVRSRMEVQLLRYDKPALISMLNGTFGPGTVSDVRFIVPRPDGGRGRR